MIRHPHPLEHVPLVPSRDLVQVSQLSRGPALDLGQDSGTVAALSCLPPIAPTAPHALQDLRPVTRSLSMWRPDEVHANGTAADKLAKRAFGRLLRVPGGHALLP